MTSLAMAATNRSPFGDQPSGFLSVGEAMHDRDVAVVDAVHGIAADVGEPQVFVVPARTLGHVQSVGDDLDAGVVWVHQRRAGRGGQADELVSASTAGMLE
jgi:hypothetical protein